MRILSFLSALLLACGTTATAWPADLTKIERTIAKEPVYETKTPKYCLLVFGREAKMRAWLVLDGNVMYVDRNGDGDLTGASKRASWAPPKDRVFKLGPLSLPGSKIQYVVSQVRIHDSGRVDIRVTRKGDFAHRTISWGKDTLMEMAGRNIGFRSGMNRDNIEEYDFQFADRPQDAPIVHVDGPLTLKPMDTKQVFVRGDTPSRFPVMVGTPGLGKGTFTRLLFFEGDPDGVAEIVFPHRDPASKSIVVKVSLKSPD
jgi:hypothetical protein